MGFTGVTNAHGPSSRPKACRSPTCSLMTTTGSNQAQGKVWTYFTWEVWVGWGPCGGGSNQVPTYLGQTSLFVFLPNMFPVFLNLQSHKVGRVSIKDFWFTVLPSLFCMAFCVFYLQLQAGPSVTPLLNQCSRLMFTVDGLWLLSCLGRSRPSVLIFCIKVATDVIKNGHNACTPKH